jgi:class 3 adenylate cyclase
MDKYNRENPDDLRIESIKIFYQGFDAEEEAKSIYDDMYQRLHLNIHPPIATHDRIPKLGVAEVLLIIILAPIAQYAVNSILDSLRKRIRRPWKGQIIIVIKLDELDPGKRFPFNPLYAKEADWDEFFKAISKHIKGIGAKSFSELIEMRIKIDEETRTFFEIEATFLNVGVVSSERLKEDERDLVLITYSFEQYHKFVKEKAGGNRGKVLNAVGDKVIVWFAAPNDAINCALAIFKDRDEFNMQRNKLNNPFQFTVGINTGLAFIDEKEGKAFSRGVLDLAGHLQKEAEPGKFLISENTYNKLEDKSSFHKHKCIDGDKIWSYIFAGIIDNEPVK